MSSILNSCLEAVRRKMNRERTEPQLVDGKLEVLTMNREIKTGPTVEEEIMKEFEQMRKLMKKLDKEPSPDSMTEHNYMKNRYPDVLPFEETRVKLNAQNGESDYINASHVKPDISNAQQQQYICCQAPLPNTFHDFWRMIWEQNVPVIVMLTRIVEKNARKAHEYWPEKVGSSQILDKLKVTFMKKEKRYKNIVLRSFKLSMDNSEKCVVQLHYKEWPDMGVPKGTEEMKNLLREVDIRKKGPSDPIVVHCSAGIGRTGTFLAIHINKEKALLKESIDIMKTVINLRHQRIGMVQSSDQYSFVYATVKDSLIERTHKPYSPNTKRKKQKNNNNKESTILRKSHDDFDFEKMKSRSFGDIEAPKESKMNDLNFLRSNLRLSNAELDS